MAKSAAKKASNLVMWAILGLLILALAGFGIGSFGGSVRVVAQVGDMEVTTQEYARALQQEQRSLQQQTGQALSISDLQNFGFDQMVLARLIAAAALDHEAAELGLSVGDLQVAEQIRAMPAFRGVDGQFDRDGYNFTLRNAGLNEREFERSVRAETAREILQGAVLGGLQPSQTFADTLAAWRFETRDVTIATVTMSDLDTGPLAPSEADLQAFFEENGDLFTVPEAREIAVAWVSPSVLVDTIEVPEATLREIYEERSAVFRQPERVLAERLGFASRADAEAALAAIAAGETDFDTLVTDRGLDLADVDQGDLAAADLPRDIAQALFALEEPGLVGPLETDLGPVVFRVNAILSATEVPFEEVRAELQQEYAADQARRQLANAVPDMEDLLAAGASLQELAAETDLRFETLTWRPGDSDGIAGYEEFQLAAAAVQDGDFAEIIEMSDGSVFALELRGVIPAALPPLADVREDVAAAWVAGSNAARVLDRAETLAASGAGLDAGEAIIDLARDSFLEGIPAEVVDRAFALAPGQTVAVAGPDATAVIVRLDRVSVADMTAPEVASAREQLGIAMVQGMAQDLYEAYGQAIQVEAEVQVNQQALNAVISSLSSGQF